MNIALHFTHHLRLNKATILKFTKCPIYNTSQSNYIYLLIEELRNKLILRIYLYIFYFYFLHIDNNAATKFFRIMLILKTNQKSTG